MNSPVQAAPVMRGLARAYQIQSLTQQGCNPFACAGTVAGCIAACASGVGTAACIACLGPAYESCKDCF
jgi:hypothetical protein